MKTVQLSATIVESGVRITDKTGFLNAPLDKDREDIGGVELAAGASQVIAPTSLTYIKGLIVSSDNRVKVETDAGEGYEERGRGRKIVLDQLNAPAIKITNLDKELDCAEIVSVDDSGDNDILTVDNWDEVTNYTYTKAVGTVINGPFTLSGAGFVIDIYRHNRVGIVIGDIEGDDSITRADEVAAAIESALQEKLGYDAIDMIYSEENERFEITLKIAGEENIEFVEMSDSDELEIGMSNPTVYLGTDDYTGKKIEVLTGDDVGSTYTIAAITGNTITISGSMENAPSAGDKLRIYDDTEECEVDVVMYR